MKVLRFTMVNGERFCQDWSIDSWQELDFYIPIGSKMELNGSVRPVLYFDIDGNVIAQTSTYSVNGLTVLCEITNQEFDNIIQAYDLNLLHLYFGHEDGKE